VDHDHAIEELLDRYFFDVDLVIAEGYKSTSLPKIEVFRKSAHDQPLDHRDETWVAMISDSDPDPGLPHLNLGEVPAIVDFIVEHFISGRAKRVATLLADGEPVLLNSFVESFIRKAVLGMTGSLKGCDKAREISITIRSEYEEDKQ
jgi:molybdopterin-guanine dinucleotide biosynthesis protein B